MPTVYTINIGTPEFLRILVLKLETKSTELPFDLYKTVKCLANGVIPNQTQH